MIWIYYHIPKCGGTTMAEALTTAMHRANGWFLQPPPGGFDVKALSSFVSALQSGGADVVVLGHNVHEFDREYSQHGAPIKRATVIRHPADILESEFHYIRRSPEHHLNQQALKCESSAEFVELFNRSNPISNTLGSPTPEFDLIGELPTLGEFAAQLFQSMEVVHAPKVPRGEPRIALTQEERNSLEKFCSKDLGIYRELVNKEGTL